jgi:hypothetical protein
MTRVTATQFGQTQKGSYWKQNWRIEGNPPAVAAFKTAVKKYIK